MPNLRISQAVQFKICGPTGRQIEFLSQFFGWSNHQRAVRYYILFYFIHTVWRCKGHVVHAASGPCCAHVEWKMAATVAPLLCAAKLVGPWHGDYFSRLGPTSAHQSLSARTWNHMCVFVACAVAACLCADGTRLTDPEMLARYTAVYGPPMAPQNQ